MTITQLLNLHPNTQVEPFEFMDYDFCAELSTVDGETIFKFGFDASEIDNVGDKIWEGHEEVTLIEGSLPSNLHPIFKKICSAHGLN